MTHIITETRQKLKISQAHMAKELGVCQSSLVHWEHGRRFPKPKYIKRLIDFCAKNGIKKTADDFYASYNDS